MKGIHWAWTVMVLFVAATAANAQSVSTAACLDEPARPAAVHLCRADQLLSKFKPELRHEPDHGSWLEQAVTELKQGAERGRGTPDVAIAVRRLVDLYSPLYLNDASNAAPLLHHLVEFGPDPQAARRELAALREGREQWGFGATFARGGDSPSPILYKYVPPVYPEAARKAGVKGVVVLKVRINEMGSVEAARVVRSVPALDAAALAAVRQWQFMRTMVRGAAAVIIADVPVTFIP